MKTNKKINTLRIAFGFASCGAFAVPAAFAHHSASAYDLSKEVVVAGTVRQFDWANPHSWVWLDVPKSGGIDVWAIESSSPGALRRAGLKWDSLQKGQKVTITVWPWRDGRHGGGLANVVWADGHNWHPTGMASPLPPGVAPTSQSQTGNKTYTGKIP